jgi:hypothetical protein
MEYYKFENEVKNIADWEKYIKGAKAALDCSVI